jgi:hypothetical protein
MYEEVGFVHIEVPNVLECIDFPVYRELMVTPERSPIEVEQLVSVQIVHTSDCI